MGIVLVWSSNWYKIHTSAGFVLVRPSYWCGIRTGTAFVLVRSLNWYRIRTGAEFVLVRPRTGTGIVPSQITKRGEKTVLVQWPYYNE